jgi:hypothetical protein
MNCMLLVCSLAAFNLAEGQIRLREVFLKSLSCHAELDKDSKPTAGFPQPKMQPVVAAIASCRALYS